MKATLNFTLPKERQELRNAERASETIGALQEYDNYLRSRLKHEDLPSAVHTALEEARAKLHECVPYLWEE